MEVIESDKNSLEFRLKGERHTFPNLLKTELLRDSKVEYAAYKLNHPMDPDSLFIIKTKGKSPKKVLEDACKRIDTNLADFKKNVKKAL